MFQLSRPPHPRLQHLCLGLPPCNADLKSPKKSKTCCLFCEREPHFRTWKQKTNVNTLGCPSLSGFKKAVEEITIVASNVPIKL